VSLAGGDNQRNIAAVALLALFLSFSSFSLYNLTTRPVACFPGDIGTSKCPVNVGSTDPVSSAASCAAANFVTGVNESSGGAVTFGCAGLPLNGCDGVYRVGIGRCETGSGTCTIAAQGTTCNTVITFATVFTNTPTVVNLANTGTGAQGRISIGFACFICPAGGAVAATWTSMPAASTELLGNTNDRLNFSNIFVGIGPIFHARVVTGSTSATAALQLQRSTNGGVSFSTVAGQTITFGTGTGDFSPVGVTGTISGSAANGIEFRVTGTGGNGVGDNPAFASVYMELTKTMIANTLDYRSLTTTGVTIDITVPAPLTGSLSPTFNWEAWSYTG
jgi:hypothetical protein